MARRQSRRHDVRAELLTDPGRIVSLMTPISRLLRMRTRLVVLGLLLAALLAACGGGDGSSSVSSAAATEPAPPSLDATSWSLAQVGGAAAKPGGFLGFAGGNVAGSTGCNGFGGTYKQSGVSLTIALGPVRDCD
jgi:hypothetical protein